MDRTGVDDIRALVATLIQTDRFGTSIAQALRVHSDSLRTARRQRAEEQAAKTTIKMVPPLVLFILVPFLCVTVGPALIQNLPLAGFKVSNNLHPAIRSGPIGFPRVLSQPGLKSPGHRKHCLPYLPSPGLQSKRAGFTPPPDLAVAETALVPPARVLGDVP